MESSSAVLTTWAPGPSPRYKYTGTAFQVQSWKGKWAIWPLSSREEKIAGTSDPTLISGATRSRPDMESEVQANATCLYVGHGEFYVTVDRVHSDFHPRCASQNTVHTADDDDDSAVDPCAVESLFPKSRQIVSLSS